MDSNTTRKLTKKVEQWHDCDANRFYYICSRLAVKPSGCKINEETGNSITVKKWTVRSSLIPGSSNFHIPHLHIKLGFMKQFVEAFEMNSKCFQDLVSKFLKFSDAKFTSTMNLLERAAWLSFRVIS